MRRPHWRKRLAEVIGEQKKLAFEWGKSDCISFVSDVIEAVNGRVYYPRHKRAVTKFEAKRRLKDFGGRCVSRILALHLDELPPAAAMTGDVAVLLTEDGQEACAVFVDNNVLARSSFGLSVFPRTRAIRAFEVR